MFTTQRKKKHLFYVLLTVHPVIILVNNQFDAQFLLVCLFLFSTCFGQPCAHHEIYCINATPVFCQWCMSPSGMQEHMLLVNNQFDVQFFLVCLFLFSTCFGQPCAHHQEIYCINATPGLCQWCMSPSGMQEHMLLHTRQ